MDIVEVDIWHVLHFTQSLRPNPDCIVEITEVRPHPIQLTFIAWMWALGTREWKITAI